MSYAAMQARIADELSRSDLTAEIQLEIASAIEWYQYDNFPWNEASTVPFNTINGQRYYPLPANFIKVTDALSQIGNYTYKMEPVTEQYIDRIDWGDVFWTSYPIIFSLWSNQIRLFPPPQGNLPVQIKGLIAQLPLITPTATWAASTAFTVGQTVTDVYGNVETCATAGTTGTAQPTWPTSSAPTSSGIGSASIPPVAGATTTDGTVVWTLTGTTSNIWTTQAEELIRSRALKNLYARYVRDQTMAQGMQALENMAYSNMAYKNVGRTAGFRIRAVF
ncbi:MAG: hypothetical protein M0038_17155 [Pseudomonadota bacterium]|jgi:hypothetical protein|nr:hypothetical protein [Pseudomonadota bacterium]